MLLVVCHSEPVSVMKYYGVSLLGSVSLAFDPSKSQKWWWRFWKEPDAPWVKIIKDKYGVVDLGWRTKQPKEKHGVSLWRNIYSDSEDFFNLSMFKIGNWDKIRLWEDKWFLEGDEGYGWDLGLNHRRRLYDSEIEELTVLMQHLDASVERVVVSWKGYNLMEQGKQLWRKLQAAIMWVVWLARNAKFFNSKDIKVPDIIRDIKIQAFNWAKGASCFADTGSYGIKHRRVLEWLFELDDRRDL
ncbi:hypothetical protein C5167_043115 [Papaver somniferum]|uniref:Reverse transcriptase zinc-binding domain-containing protein n=1 Tax=Papaver somniferum TaxID=3469 RepID=A0A4Y7L7W6_PAPSO|nr:hypothetical protein C5167_043115 [Papaver somniferum]